MSHSDLAARIMTVPKRDGEVCICGNYKVTVNPAFDVDQYPLPIVLAGYSASPHRETCEVTCSSSFPG